MKSLKLCIWENIASPHQSYFFKALSEHPKVDLVVRYFENFHHERKKMGWENRFLMEDIELYVKPNIPEALQTIEDWKQRIHIIPGNSYHFTRQLIDKLIHSNVPWVHWSERGGIVLAQKLSFNMNLFNSIYPIYTMVTKRNYAKKINKTALGALGQGELATRDFMRWGVDSNKIGELFYTIGKTHPKKMPSDFPVTDGTTFLYVGSLLKGKGVKYLLKAFAKAKRQTDQLIIIGDGPLREELNHLSIKLKIDQNTFFLGYKPIEEIPSYMSHSDVFVLPTLFDGWGAVLNEAASVGKALISTNQCGAAYHLIEDGINGFKIKAGDVKSLADAMSKYLTDPQLKMIHGKNSKRIYEEYFTPQKNVERLLTHLQNWIAQS